MSKHRGPCSIAWTSNRAGHAVPRIYGLYSIRSHSLCTLLPTHYALEPSQYIPCLFTLCSRILALTLLAYSRCALGLFVVRSGLHTTCTAFSWFIRCAPRIHKEGPDVRDLLRPDSFITFLFNDKNRNFGMLGDVVTDTSKHEFADAAKPPAADDNDVKSFFLYILQYCRRR